MDSDNLILKRDIPFKLVRVATVNRSLNKLLEGQLAFMSTYFDIMAVSSPDPTTEKLRKREKIEIRDVEMIRGIDIVSDLKAILKMYLIFREVKPDIVHSHTPKAGLVAMTAAWMARVPVRMHTVAGLPLETSKGLQQLILKGVERWTYKVATGVYPNSYGLRDFIIKNQLSSSAKVKVIGNGSSNGIDLRHFRRSNEILSMAEKIRSELKLTKDFKIFTYVGRLVVDKGIEPLMEAWKELYRKHRNIALVLVGSYESHLSPLPSSVIDMIDNLEGVFPVKYQYDVRPFLALADYFVFPSYREGLPNAVLQAGAMELPLIVTDINGNSDIVDEGINGIFVKSKNKESLFKAMEKFLLEPEFVAKLKTNARPTITKKYDREFLYNEMLLEYESQIKQNHKS